MRKRRPTPDRAANHDLDRLPDRTDGAGHAPAPDGSDRQPRPAARTRPAPATTLERAVRPNQAPAASRTDRPGPPDQASAPDQTPASSSPDQASASSYPDQASAPDGSDRQPRPAAPPASADPAAAAATASRAGPRIDSPLAILSLAGAMVIVGSSVAVGRLMTLTLPLQAASAARFALACLVLFPLLFLTEGRLPRLSARSHLALAAQGLTGSFLFTVCLLHGMTLTSPASAGVLASLTPAAMVLAAWVIFRERPGRRAMLGVALAMAGMVAVRLADVGPFAGTAAAADQAGPAGATGGGGLAGGLLGSALWGDLLVLAAVCCEAAFLLLRKTVREELSPLAAASLVSAWGLVFFLPGGIVEARGVEVAALSATALSTVAYSGLAVTVGAYLLWFYGVTRASAAAAGTVTGIMPVSALACTALLLGQTPTLAHLTGCALVLGGILAVSRQGAPRRVGIREPEGPPRAG